ncbi:VOC family protein [Pseudarthrobacter sp. H2]|uniref:VOC family protein n=1 Tax=Pseudarthrobacter sp. H2 TaxID=3418415 RepID=UPI003CEEBFE3
MLRARPVHFTSRPDQWERLLTDLGLVKSVDGTEWREFDAGAGRLALHLAAAGSAEDGTTAFGVEVGDLAEFARRTNQAGVETGNAPAELIRADHGDSCRITGEDGFTFLADTAAKAAAADKAAPGAGSADADPALAVVEVWFTEDAAAAAATLRSIGARFRPVPDADETADFTAKNGGVLMVRPGSGPARAGLGFEYGGDLDALRGRLTAAGHDVTLVEEAFGRSLHVPSPDAEGVAAHHPALWIASARGPA